MQMFVWMFVYEKNVIQSANATYQSCILKTLMIPE